MSQLRGLSGGVAHPVRRKFFLGCEILHPGVTTPQGRGLTKQPSNTTGLHRLPPEPADTEEWQSISFSSTVGGTFVVRFHADPIPGRRSRDDSRATVGKIIRTHTYAEPGGRPQINP